MHKANNFNELVKKIDIEKTGFKTIEELNTALEEFYPKEKQKNFGVLGIKIRL